LSKRSAPVGQDLEILPRAVDRGREAGRAAPDDDEVVLAARRRPGEPHGVGELVVGRLGEEGAVGKDDRGDDPLAGVARLHLGRALGLELEVDPREGDPVGREELLGPPTVRAPGGAEDNGRGVG